MRVSCGSSHKSIFTYLFVSSCFICHSFWHFFEFTILLLYITHSNNVEDDVPAVVVSFDIYIYIHVSIQLGVQGLRSRAWVN